MLGTLRKISKDKFIKKYKKSLDIQIQKVFKDFYLELQFTFPESKLFQCEKVKIDKSFISYQTFFLESSWKKAPHEEFFRKYQNAVCQIDDLQFTLVIEDNFLKSKSKISFYFISKYN